MHDLMAICHQTRKGGHDGSHWSNQRRAYFLLDSIPAKRVLRDPNGELAGIYRMDRMALLRNLVAAR